MSSYIFSGPNTVSDFGIDLRYGANHSLGLKLSPFSSFGRALLDEKRKLIIFSSPKVGSSTLKHFAAKHLKIPRIVDPADENKVQEGIWPTLAETKFLDTRRRIVGGALYWNDYKDHRKVFIIREPYDRLVSFWRNKFFWMLPYFGNKNRQKFQATIKEIEKTYQWLLGKDVDPRQHTFEHFLQALYERYQRQDSKLPDPHLAPQLTADFIAVAPTDVEFKTLSQLSHFLEELEPGTKDIKLNPTSPNEKEFLKDAYKLGMEQLVENNLFSRLSNSSFYSEELDKMVQEIYADDQSAWEKVLAKN
jgi:hypothetical protein